MDARTVITKRRDGKKHDPEELQFLALGAARGTIPDYQLSAWLMAAYLNPLDEEETAWLTMAMADSGERLDLSSLPQPCLDKHSTGGVGDKTSIVLLPLLAACGVTLVKISGRGLGITGGTLDKLASVPGFRVDLSPRELLDQASRIGVALTGQTPDLAPADKALYALRDATATVASVPLIVSSILSKKLAAGAKAVVLDVKCGSGSFMRSSDEARDLAGWLIRVGEQCGLNVSAAITDMNQPLGRAVGNALEVKEAIRVLKGEDTGRFRELCIELSALALESCGLAGCQAEGRRLAESVLSSGQALERAKEWFQAQGGDLSVFESESWCVSAYCSRMVHQGPEGFVAAVDAGVVGLAVLELGGGRKSKEDAVDPTVGVVLDVEVGSPVRPGLNLATAYANGKWKSNEAALTLFSAFKFSPTPIERRPALLETLP